ncbi:hypothetical protein [Streptomyces griseorubiginosus]|uniref:hypothetical protein n=1 Tax=Streptomyces griseorubiginosus TaxID=67304 RepID=UPI001AD70F5A|nr:hypothetical protein [Streptomyces griseorubiginosus]MBO4253183.1 hypothetical protein [Streptomyces griseorubiginosus]
MSTGVVVPVGAAARVVPPEKFEWCEWTSSTDATQIGYRLQDVGDDNDFTITLTP